MFAVLWYNIWRLTDFLLKAGVDGEMDYEPVLTAGECVELALLNRHKALEFMI